MFCFCNVSLIELGSLYASRTIFFFVILQHSNLWLRFGVIKKPFKPLVVFTTDLSKVVYFCCFLLLLFVLLFFFFFFFFFFFLFFFVCLFFCLFFFVVVFFFVDRSL